MKTIRLPASPPPQLGSIADLVAACKTGPEIEPRHVPSIELLTLDASNSNQCLRSVSARDPLPCATPSDMPERNEEVHREREQAKARSILCDVL